MFGPNKRGRKGVGLSSSQRTKLRRLVAAGKLEHKWGYSWEMTDEIRAALGIKSAVEIAEAEDERRREGGDEVKASGEGSKLGVVRGKKKRAESSV